MDYNDLTKIQLIEIIKKLQTQKLYYSESNLEENGINNIYKLNLDERLHIFINDANDNIEKKSFHDDKDKYRTLFEKSKDAILVIENGKFVDCNQATIEMLGYNDKKEFLQTHPSELSPEKQPDGRFSNEKANEMMQIAIEKGSNRFEWEHVRYNGEVFPVEVLLTAINTEEHNQIIHTVWRDITERKLSEKALINSEINLKKSLKRMELIRAFHETFIDALDLNTVYKRLNEFCIRHLKDSGVSKVDLQLTDYKNYSSLSEIKGNKNLNSEINGPFFQNRDDSILKHCLASKKTIIVEDCQKSDLVSDDWVKAHSLKSFIAVPLFLNNNIIGVLRFDNTEITGAFSERDIDFYYTLADQLGAVIGNVRMFADLKAAEEQTRLSEERLKIIFESAPDAFFISDLKGNLLDGNKAAEELIGASRDDLIGKNLLNIDILKSKDLLNAIKNIAKNAMGKSTGPEEFTIHTKDGKTVAVEVSNHPVVIKDTPVILGIARNISKRKEAELIIKENRDRIEKQNIAITRLAVDKNINKGNVRAALRTLMKTTAEILNVSRAGVWFLSNDDKEFKSSCLYDADKGIHLQGETFKTKDIKKYINKIKIENNITSVNAQNDPLFRELCENYINPLNIVSVMHTSIRSAGKIIGTIWIEQVSDERKWLPEEQSFVGTISTLVAQTLINEEHKKAVKELGKSEDRFRRLFADLGDAVFVTKMGSGDRGLIVEVNPAAEQQTGYSRNELIGMNIIDDISIKDSWEVDPVLWEEKLKKGELVSTIEKKRKKDGTEYWSEVVVTHIEYNGISCSLSINHDITARRELETQLRQSQKMEAIGQLAGGVAHDFNNLLTVINGYCDLLMMQELPQDLEDGLSHIQNAGLRAKRLTSQLLAFSRKQIIQPRLINLNDVISDYVKMIGRLLGENIEIAADLNHRLNVIKADPGQIEQIIMNIVINARDAMPAGGKLMIKTDNVELDKSFLKKHPDAAPGKYIMLSIQDTGTGMDQETMSHIFEPFFTTKGRDKGTGLGLATVYGIIKQNEGFITVESEIEKGSIFRIYFVQAEDIKESETQIILANKFLNGNETIMLVEDDPGVRAVTRSILENYSYKVFIASNGEEALRLYKKHSKKINLVLTDLIMPLMGGEEMVQQIRMLNPGIKVLFFSGYTENNFFHENIDNNDAMDFIQKPYEPIELLRKIKEMLN